MSTTTDSTPRPPSRARRYLFLFLLGLVVGVIATVAAMNALDARRDHFPESLMFVQQAQIGLLKKNLQANRCTASDVVPRLQTLRALAGDLETAFPGLAGETRFQQHASQYRATLDTALGAPPISCAALGQVVQGIGKDCKSCHQDYQN
jgi:hypothetical protein